MAKHSKITTQKVSTSSRLTALPKAFPASYLEFENLVYKFAAAFSEEQYKGGEWELFTTSNGATFMALASDIRLPLESPNENRAVVDGFTFGLAISMWVSSHLANTLFERNPDWEAHTENFHRLSAAVSDIATESGAKAIYRFLD